MTKRAELVDKVIKKAIIITFHMFKKGEKSLSIIKTDMESIKVTQINFKRKKKKYLKNTRLDGIKRKAGCKNQTKRLANLKI